jgi:anti-sigma regulatory factor (Ser/Thr protein kinase)
LADALSTRTSAEFIGDVELVVSELVSNAVDANADRIDLRLLVGDELVRVEVRDDAPGLPRARAPGPDSRRGRGLLIVGTVATAWGFETGAAPKCVWAEFALG